MKQDLLLEDIVRSLFATKHALDQTVDRLTARRLQIQAAYLPRVRFERWRDSKEGQNWKSQQFEKQKGCCALCEDKIALKGSHIDHIWPLSKFPDRALDLKNLQICCPPCNNSKQAKTPGSN
jgi:5-methylcytosine-specific restriction endonuclease McrA